MTSMSKKHKGVDKRQVEQEELPKSTKCGCFTFLKPPPVKDTFNAKDQHDRANTGVP